jgi:hypothetical protein
VELGRVGVSAADVVVRRVRQGLSDLERSEATQKEEETQMKDLGKITFGKSRPAPKQVIVDVTYDAKTAKALHAFGLKQLKKDPEAVIEYVIVKALEAFAKK